MIVPKDTAEAYLNDEARWLLTEQEYKLNYFIW